MKGPSVLRITNATSLRQFVRFEPEGDYVHLAPGGRCDIEPAQLPDEFLVNIEGEDQMAIYIDEWSSVSVDGKKVSR